MAASSIDAIKAAIAQLPKSQQVSLAVWLDLETADAWDREMQRDFAPGGKGTSFVERMKAQTAAAKRKGTVEPLEKGFARRRKRA